MGTQAVARRTLSMLGSFCISSGATESEISCFLVHIGRPASNTDSIDRQTGIFMSADFLILMEGLAGYTPIVKHSLTLDEVTKSIRTA